MYGKPAIPGNKTITGILIKISDAIGIGTTTIKQAGKVAETKTKMTLHLIACAQKQAHMVQDCLVLLPVPLAKQQKTSSSLTVLAAA